MSRIGGNSYRNAPTRGLGNRLYFVILFGKELSASIQPSDEAVNVIFLDAPSRLHQVIFLAGTKRRQRTTAGQCAVYHQPRQLFKTQALDQVGGSDVCRQPRSEE